MAGKRLGNIFVELGLDSTEFTKGEAKILKQAQSTSLKMEEDWRRLGSHSDKIFNAMRDNIINAQNAIVNNSKSSAAERMRAEQMAADKIRQINEQQYGHHTTMLEGLKKNWIAASVAIGAAMVVMNKAWDLAKIGAAYAEQEGILNNLSKKYNTTADEMVKAMARASDGMIANVDLMEVALGGIAKGMKPEQMIKLSEAAALLGDTINMGPTEALKKLAEALESGKMKGLKSFAGATIDLGVAFGELESKLTEAERAQAMYFLMMQHYEKLQKEQTKAVDSAADKIDRMEASYNNAKLAAAGFFKTIIAGMYDMVVAMGNVPSYDITGMGGGSETPQVKGKVMPATPKVDPIKQAQAEIDAIRKTAQARLDAETKTNKVKTDSHRADREAQKQHEFIVDLYIKDEARKWEELEKYEQDYLKILHDKAEEESKISAKQKQNAENYRQLMAQMNIDIADGHEKAILQIMEDDQRMADNITKLLDDGGDIDEAMKAYEKIAERTGKAIEDVFKNDLIKSTELFNHQLRSLSHSFGLLSNACLDIASIYAEGSEAAKQWEEAAKAMEIAQRAVVVVQAVAAIATQGLGDPYTAFARIAAMAAAMGALLASIGESIGSGGSVSASIASKPASTVLGAENGTGSESVLNSFEMLDKIYKVEDTKLTNIYNELKDLNNNIIGLVTSFLRSGGTGAVSFGVPGDTTTMFSDMAEFLNQNITEGLNGSTIGIASALAGLPGANYITGWATELIGSAFAGAQSSQVTEQGFAIGKNMVGNLLSGAQASIKNYAQILTTTEGGWFNGDDTSVSYQYQALTKDQLQVQTLITKIFKGIGGSLVAVAEGLGTDVAAAKAYIFEATKINLQGKTAEEITKSINEYFSNIADKAAAALFQKAIGEYQKVGEGLLETAVRLLADREVIAKYLDMTNQKFQGTIPAAIKFSETLITIAGGLDKLTDAMQTYYDAFFNDAEKQAKLKSQLEGGLGQYGFDLPGTRSGYRALVESLNLTTDAGQAAYVALMQMSKGADEYYKYLEQAKSSINPAQYSTNLEYQRALAGLPKFADGGMAVGPDSGYAVALHGTEVVLSQRKSYPVSVKSESYAELVAEVKALREEIRNITTNTYKTANNTEYLETWNSKGLPN